MTDLERVKKALEEEYGIRSYEELKAAMEKSKGFSLALFVNPIKVKKSTGNGGSR